MTTRMLASRAKGFTLLELLVALVVVGFVVVGLAQGVHFGLVAWDVATRVADGIDDIDAVDTTLRHVIEGIDPGDDLNPARLVGNSSSVNCVTSLPSAAGPLPHQRVQAMLLVDGDHRLVLRRRLSLRRQVAAGCIAAGAAASALMLVGGRQAQADEHLTLIDKIDVGGDGLGAFDISFVDPVIDLYVLADRTNASVDFIDSGSHTFLFRVGGFKGVVLEDGKPNNDKSGPDGVVITEHREVWAGDGDSTLKVIDISTRKIVDTISTGGQLRVDEMAWDSRKHILAAANNADTPPFVTLVDTDSHKILGKITFDGTSNTPNATNGIEQPQWSPATGMFYVSVPQIGSDLENGGIAVIDPHSKSVVATFLVRDCSPAGLTMGPHRQALAGCSASFGTSPNVLTQSIVFDIVNGEIKANITQVGGSDEVWYDRGSNHYYLAARANADTNGVVTPVLGFVDAATNTFDGSVDTSTTAHSVAADRTNRFVFVPIGFVPSTDPPGTDPNNPCRMKGCIAVFRPSGTGGDDHGRGHGVVAQAGQ